MIVSCGEALVDMIPNPVPGGGPMNVAVAAARLSAPAAFVGRISTDHHGDAIWQHLADSGVDLRACERGPEPTARAIVEHTPRLAFRFEGEGTADTALAAVDLGVLEHGPHIVHGGTLGMFRGRTAETLAQLVESHDGVVSLDPNVRPQIIDDRERWAHFHHRWLSCSDIYRASDEDFEWIWPGRSPESCAEELLTGRCRVVMATLGADGVRLFTVDGEARVEGVAVEVVDTVGAGDTFVAATLVGVFDAIDGAVGGPADLDRLSLGDWCRIGARAVVAAGITCSRAGADPPTRDELDAAVG